MPAFITRGDFAQNASFSSPVNGWAKTSPEVPNASRPPGPLYGTSLCEGLGKQGGGWEMGSQQAIGICFLSTAATHPGGLHREDKGGAGNTIENTNLRKEGETGDGRCRKIKGAAEPPNT